MIDEIWHIPNKIKELADNAGDYHFNLVGRFELLIEEDDCHIRYRCQELIEELKLKCPEEVWKCYDNLLRGIRDGYEFEDTEKN